MEPRQSLITLQSAMDAAAERVRGGGGGERVVGQEASHLYPGSCPLYLLGEQLLRVGSEGKLYRSIYMYIAICRAACGIG